MTESDERLTRLIENDAYATYHEWAKYIIDDPAKKSLRVTVQDTSDYGDGRPMHVELDGHGLFEISVSVKRLPRTRDEILDEELSKVEISTEPGANPVGKLIEVNKRVEERLDLERRLQVRKEMVAAGIPESFELKVHEAGSVAHFLAEMDQHFGLPGEGTCPECTDYTDDPSTWCDCRSDEEPCVGTCKQRAHHPMNCSARTPVDVEVRADKLAEGDQIFSDATGQWHEVISASTHGTTTLVIDRNNGSTFQLKVRPEQIFKARRGPAGLLIDTLGGEVIHSA